MTRLGVRALSRALQDTEYAMSAAGVTRAKGCGRLVFDPDGKITLEEALRQLKANTNPAQSKRARAQQGKPRQEKSDAAKHKDKRETTAEALNRKETALANLKELEEAEKRKSLLSAEDVEDAGNEMVIAFQSKILVIPGEMADRLAATSDSIKCKELLDERLREALSVLSVYQANVA